MKKLICGLMAGIMALSLMACGQSSASAQTEGSTAEDKTQVETADKETEKAEEVQEGSSGEPIELTMYFPVSVGGGPDALIDALCKQYHEENPNVTVKPVYAGSYADTRTKVQAAIKAGKDIALANKETLVAGGNIVMSSASEKGVSVYPVDSEHSAIYQCLQGNSMNRISKIILTASGGPFFGKKKDELKNVTVKDALNHPNWSMGNKITIDSSTLMNKGLEFIEAKWLFDLEPEQIEIVVHRQSVLHSAVQYEDYSVIGQMGVPDMRIPIQYALLYPCRIACPTKPLSLTDYGTLTFEKPDFETFDCLSVCIEAIKKGGAYPCIVNAANEVAVGYFLEGKISFLQIGELVREAYEHFNYSELNTYEDVLAADTAAREFVRNLVK